MTETRARSKELGEFLKTRRARLAPADVNLPPGVRRRTAGLRREEVAQLTGIGITWYTWLEQGRDIQVSVEVLESLARVLQFNREERAHLFLLARQHLPPTVPAIQETISPALQRVLDSFSLNPAYIAGRNWDLLAWNRAALLVFGDFSTLQGLERNLIWLFFTNRDLRRLFVNWEHEAQQLLAQFRASSASMPEDPWLRELINTLQQTSREFRQWWPQYQVHGRESGQKELFHPHVGKLVLEHTTFQVNDEPDLKLMIYTPLAETDTVRKIQQLLSTEHAIV